jgi:hypothetical protein
MSVRSQLKALLDSSRVNHEKLIMEQTSLKDAHVYCALARLSAQQYGLLLEKYIRTKFGYDKNKAKDCTGDLSKNGENVEVKVSLGGKNYSKFNYVQLRPFHQCTYLLTAYHLSHDNLETNGELYLFRIPKDEMKRLIVSHGGYAHGTIKEHGRITEETLNDETKIKEYALRPTMNDNCWKALLPFRVSEETLQSNSSEYSLTSSPLPIEFCLAVSKLSV